MLKYCAAGNYVLAPSPHCGIGLGTVPVESSLGNPAAEQDGPDIHASLGGDDEAFARLVKRYQPMVYRQMWRFSRDPDTLDDLVQEVFIEVFRSLSGYKAKAPFLHWVRRIATRTGYRFWKRNARIKRVRDEIQQHRVELVSAPGKVSASEAAETLHQLLELLPPRDRLILTLIYFDECSTAEAAERVAVPLTHHVVPQHRADAASVQLVEARLDVMQVERPLAGRLDERLRVGMRAEAPRLVAAEMEMRHGRHQREHVAASQAVADDLLLERPKGVKAEVALERFWQVGSSVNDRGVTDRALGGCFGWIRDVVPHDPQDGARGRAAATGKCHRNVDGGQRMSRLSTDLSNG